MGNVSFQPDQTLSHHELYVYNLKICVFPIQTLLWYCSWCFKGGIEKYHLCEIISWNFQNIWVESSNKNTLRKADDELKNNIALEFILQQYGWFFVSLSQVLNKVKDAF